MNHARFLLSVLFLVAALGSVSSAQVRTFVASTGSDANPCSRTAPCRTLQAAADSAAPGGEVVALDSAGFGSNVSIAKSISIVAAPGVYAGITVFSGDGVDINAGPTDTVVLRGITVVNQGSAGSGIVLNAAGILHVENCVVNGFSGGIGIIQNGGRLEVKDSIMRGNFEGILVLAGLTATIDQVRLEGGQLGLSAGGKVVVRNSLASGNGGPGFNVGFFAQLNLENCVASNNNVGVFAQGSNAGASTVHIENCLMSNNNFGVQAVAIGAGTVTVKISNSTVTDNGTGLSADVRASGGMASILSRGNNTVEDNTTNTATTGGGSIGTYASK
jgi:hypothetical protein